MPFAAHEHPRLLFDAAELATLRERAQAGLRRRVLQHLCYRCSDNVPDSSDPSTRSGDRSVVQKVF
jgi:hypothetical protein